ncbi:MAG: phosphomannomutase/phosphoglucomutase [Alphaproteobacteria bacterium]|nr:phosphomannomutase/phosphoglucomutase [Alphaproteobacteria bacterium]
MSAGHRLDPTILREYDIRGIVGQDLDIPDVYAAARAFGTVIARAGGSSVAVGYDGRKSSPGFADAAVKGICDCGLEALSIGLGPTPMLYFSVKSLPTDAGLMITGSHNPASYNGIKLMRHEGAFYGPDIRDLGRMAKVADYAEGNGRVRNVTVFDGYVMKLAEAYGTEQGLKVAWDAGNGAAGPAMAALTKRIPGDHILLNEAIDSTFPNHHPDPTVAANLNQLIEVVRAEGCDLGIAFDGDGDRIGAVDGDGSIVWADQLMTLFAADVLTRHPGATIISEVKASQVLYDEIERLGGKSLMWKTGHSLLKAKMAETGAPLAGEMSGHIFFADTYYGFDDGLYAAVRLLDILARGGETLAVRMARLPSVENTPELRFQVDEARKFTIVETVRDQLRQAGAEMNDVDGVRVKTDDGWWLLRASNTQNVLVARCEALDEAGLVRLKAAVVQALTGAGVELPDF